MGGTISTFSTSFPMGTSWWQCVSHIIEVSYDVTTYLAEHPGGDDILLRHGGLDASAEFKKINHTPYAISLRDARLVGAITADPMPAKYKKLVE